MLSNNNTWWVPLDGQKPITVWDSPHEKEGRKGEELVDGYKKKKNRTLVKCTMPSKRQGTHVGRKWVTRKIVWNARANTPVTWFVSPLELLTSFVGRVYCHASRWLVSLVKYNHALCINELLLFFSLNLCVKSPNCQAILEKSKMDSKGGT